MSPLLSDFGFADARDVSQVCVDPQEFLRLALRPEADLQQRPAHLPQPRTAAQIEVLNLTRFHEVGPND